MSWMKTSSILLVLVIAVVMMTAGCTSNQPAATATKVATEVATPAVPAQSTGLANPASVYCGQVGGKTEIKKDATGAEYGICTFPNGSSCEEWALYRGECTPTPSKVANLTADVKTAVNNTVANVTNKTPVANLTADVKTAVNKTVANLTTAAKDAVNNTTTKK
jgi:putative hemolysin